MAQEDRLGAVYGGIMLEDIIKKQEIEVRLHKCLDRMEHWLNTQRESFNTFRAEYGRYKRQSLLSKKGVKARRGMKR